jgi:hypothetical protein
METPSLRLAKKIVERLVQEKLLTEHDANRILPKLADGKLRPEDWRLPVELAETKEAQS